MKKIIPCILFVLISLSANSKNRLSVIDKSIMALVLWNPHREIRVQEYNYRLKFTLKIGNAEYSRLPAQGKTNYLLEFCDFIFHFAIDDSVKFYNSVTVIMYDTIRKRNDSIQVNWKASTINRWNEQERLQRFRNFIPFRFEFSSGRIKKHQWRNFRLIELSASDDENWDNYTMSNYSYLFTFMMVDYVWQKKYYDRLLFNFYRPEKKLIGFSIRYKKLRGMKKHLQQFQSN